MFKQKKTSENKSQSESLLKSFTLNKVFFIFMSFEDRSSLYFQRQRSWSTESVHPGFINPCYYSDTRKKLWLCWPSAIRLQIGTSPQRAEKPSLHVAEYPGVLFQESGPCCYVVPAQRQVGSAIKARLTQHPDLCTLQVCDAWLSLYFC